MKSVSIYLETKYSLVLSIILFAFFSVGCKNNTHNLSAQTGVDSTIIKEAMEQERRFEQKRINFKKAAEGLPYLSGDLVSIEGEHVSLEDFDKEILVLDFWAPWCAPCLKKIPEFYAVMETYKDNNISFLLVSVDEDFEGWKQFSIEKDWVKNSYWVGGESVQNPLYWYTYYEMESDEGGSVNVISALPKQVVILKENGTTYKNYIPEEGSLRLILSELLGE